MTVETYEGPTLSSALQRAMSSAGAGAEVVSVHRGPQNRVTVSVRIHGGELGSEPTSARGSAAQATPSSTAKPPGAASRPRQVGAASGAPDSHSATAVSEWDARMRLLGLRSRRRESLLVGEDVVDRASLTRRLARHLSCEEEPALNRDRARRREPRILILVGPTGVGKTTTAAKLAAQVHLGWNSGREPDQLAPRQRLGLVTLDTFRVGAVEQLGTYAELLGSPLRVAESPADLLTAINELSDCDLIVVDTAGRSPRDRAGLRQLERAIALVPQAEVLLTLPATSRLAELDFAQELYAGCRPSALVLTKLDEAVATGDAFELLARTRLPLRLLCDGQQVPDDLHPAQPLGVARWVLDPTGSCA